jgi:hypothetical protein
VAAIGSEMKLIMAFTRAPAIPGGVMAAAGFGIAPESGCYHLPNARD